MKSELPAFEFDSGSSAQGNLTGSCRECQNGRHHECKSLREHDADIYPWFDDHDGETISSSWYCPCLDDAERRGDHAKHGQVE